MKKFLIDLNDVNMSNYEKVKSEEVVRLEREINGEKVTEDFYLNKMNNKLKSFSTFHEKGVVVVEKRAVKFFDNIVLSNKSNVVAVDQYLSKDKTHKIFIYNRNNEVFGVENLAILMTKENSIENFNDKTFIEVSGFDFLAEKMLVEDKTPKEIEGNFSDRIYDLCYNLKIGMNLTGINGLKSVFAKLDEYLKENPNTILTEEIYDGLFENKNWITFDVYNMFSTWMLKEEELKDLNMKNYIKLKLERLEKVKEINVNI